MNNNEAIYRGNCRRIQEYTKFRHLRTLAGHLRPHDRRSDLLAAIYYIILTEKGNLAATRIRVDRFGLRWVRLDGHGVVSPIIAAVWEKDRGSRTGRSTTAGYESACTEAFVYIPETRRCHVIASEVHKVQGGTDSRNAYGPCNEESSVWGGTNSVRHLK